MQCAKCGNANDDSGRFCTSCGAPLGDAAAGSQSAPAAEPAAPQSAPAVPEPVPVAPQPAQPVYAPPPGQAAYPPQAYAQPAYAAVPPAPAPKKRRGCVIAIVVLVVLTLCCCGSAAAAYFGAVSLGKPKDLGVRYTQKDYDSATTKLGIDVSSAGPDSPTAKMTAEAAAAAGLVQGALEEQQPPEDDGAAAGGGSTSGGTTGGGSTSGTGVKRPEPPAVGPAAGTIVIYEGSVPVDIEMTSEEFSALVSLNHYSPNWLVKDMQVKFGDGNTVEMSGYVEYEGQRYPVYVAGIAELAGPRTVGGTATAVNVAGWEVPAEYYPFAAEFLAGLMNDWLAQMPGLNLESVDISGGMVHIKGTMPARVIRVQGTR